MIDLTDPARIDPEFAEAIPDPPVFDLSDIPASRVAMAALVARVTGSTPTGR